MTDKDKLLKALYGRFGGWGFKTSDVNKAGIDTYSNRALKNARDFAAQEKPYLVRVSDLIEKAKFGHFGHEDSYKLTKEGIEYARNLGQLTLF